MADVAAPVTPEVAAAVPLAAPAAAPSVLAPVDAAVPIPVPDAGAAPAAAPEAKPETPAITPSLLEAASGKPPAKEAAASPEQPAPVEAAKPDAKDAKATEAKKEEPAKTPDPVKEATAQPEPPAPVKYEAFKVPDGVKLDDKELAKFTEVAGLAQVKQEDAQKLVDLYVAERQRDVDAAQQEQRKVWDTLNDTWKSDLRKDPILGGNRLETSLSMAKAVIEEYGGSPEQVRELLAHTSNNGMGNFPGFVRLLHNIGVAMNVFEDSVVPANPSPPKATKSPGNRGWYENMGNGQAAP